MVKLIFKAYKKTDKRFLNNFFFLYIKVLTEYYQKNKEKLSKKACEKYQNLSEEEKGQDFKKKVDFFFVFQTLRWKVR